MPIQIFASYTYVHLRLNFEAPRSILKIIQNFWKFGDLTFKEWDKTLGWSGQISKILEIRDTRTHIHSYVYVHLSRQIRVGGGGSVALRVFMHVCPARVHSAIGQNWSSSAPSHAETRRRALIRPRAPRKLLVTSVRLPNQVEATSSGASRPVNSILIWRPSFAPATRHRYYGKRSIRTLGQFSIINHRVRITCPPCRLLPHPL